jgi:hypothetical protein
MPITLYHVSFNLNEPLHKEFIPRIPDNTINEEDTETARVCFSDSIQGCIRAKNGYPKIDSDYVDIIVWKHQFEDNEDGIYDWKFLYATDRVPDAAVTHEYWYTKRITLDGEVYRIFNIEYKTLYAFRLGYKETVLQLLSEYVGNLSVFADMDPCTIINEWVPENLPTEEEEIIQRLKEALTFEKRQAEEESQYTKIFEELFGDNDIFVEQIPDYDATDMLTAFEIKKI